MSQTTDYLNSTQCAAPAIRTNIDVAGLLTTCDAIIPTDAELEGYLVNGSGQFRLLSVPFRYAWEAKACRAKQNNMADFINASMVDMSAGIAKEDVDGTLLIRPFIQVKRTGPMNNNFWVAQGGTLALVDGTVDAGGTYWNMSMSSPTGIPLHKDWFIPMEWVFVESLAADGTMIKWAGEVVKSVANGTTDITVTMAPRMTNTALSAARSANPTDGSATRGVGNINKFKSFCSQPPGLIDGQLDPLWIGWTRSTFRITSHYKAWLDLVLTGGGEGNQLFKEVFYLETAKYNKQVAEDFQAKEVESFFWNTPLPGQAKSTYALTYNGTSSGGLPLIETGVDAVGGNKCMGRDANPIGIYEQHVSCQRVVDLQGTPLSLPSLCQALYKMRRMREAIGAPVPVQNVFEIGMPENYFPLFQAGMLNLYKTQWGEWANQVRLNIDVQQAKVAPMGWLYYEFPLQFPVGAKIRVIIDRAFDDRASHFATLATTLSKPGYANLGNRLWIMDWSGVKKYILDSKTVQSNPGGDLALSQRVGAIDPCRMETPSEDITMRAWLWTAYVNCPKSNLIIENASFDVPTTGPVVDDYDTN